MSSEPTNSNKQSDKTPAIDGQRPGAKVGSDAIEASGAVVETLQLATNDRDANGILNGILDGLASLVDHDAAGVYVVDPSGKRVHYSMMRGCENPVPDLQAPFSEHGVVGQVLETGKLLSLTDHPSVSEGRPAAHSRLIVPLIGSRCRVRGALDVWSDRPNGYERSAAQILEVYASAVAATIERARLSAEVRDRRRLDSDLALARHVMAGLLPHDTPNIQGFDIAGAHESSFLVGGDYYEFMPLDQGRWGVVIADVVGKGIPAALLVAATRASISSLVGHELAVRAVMRRANRFFHQSVEDGRYVTLFYMVLDVEAQRLLYVNAGHVPPILVRADGEVALFEEGGVPLGMFESPRYFEGHAALQPGDTLVLYTDGIVEAMDEHGEEYGRAGIVEAVRADPSASATELCSKIMHDVRRFGKDAPADDRTLVIIRATNH